MGERLWWGKESGPFKRSPLAATMFLEVEHGRFEVAVDVGVDDARFAERVGELVGVLANVGYLDGAGPVLVGVVRREGDGVEFLMRHGLRMTVVRDGVVHGLVGREVGGAGDHEEVVAISDSGELLDDSAGRAVAVTALISHHEAVVHAFLHDRVDEVGLGRNDGFQLSHFVLVYQVHLRVSDTVSVDDDDECSRLDVLSPVSERRLNKVRQGTLFEGLLSQNRSSRFIDLRRRVFVLSTLASNLCACIAHFSRAIEQRGLSNDEFGRVSCDRTFLPENSLVLLDELRRRVENVDTNEQELFVGLFGEHRWHVDPPRLVTEFVDDLAGEVAKNRIAISVVHLAALCVVASIDSLANIASSETELTISIVIGSGSALVGRNEGNHQNISWVVVRRECLRGICQSSLKVSIVLACIESKYRIGRKLERSLGSLKLFFDHRPVVHGESSHSVRIVNNECLNSSSLRDVGELDIRCLATPFRSGLYFSLWSEDERRRGQHSALNCQEASVDLHTVLSEGSSGLSLSGLSDELEKAVDALYACSRLDGSDLGQLSLGRCGHDGGDAKLWKQINSLALTAGRYEQWLSHIRNLEVHLSHVVGKRDRFLFTSLAIRPDESASWILVKVNVLDTIRLVIVPSSDSLSFKHAASLIGVVRRTQERQNRIL